MQASHQFTVLKNIKPVAIIPGRALRTTTAPDKLSLKGTGFVVTCDTSGDSSDSSTTSTGLTYTWEVYQDGALRSDIVSISKQKRNFLLPAYSLDAGGVYEVRLSVYSTTYLSTGTASVDIVVESADVVAAISGGVEQSGPPSESVQLTAIDSRDH